MASACSSVIASGFSQMTCLPASSAAITWGWCKNGGVAIYTRSTSSRARSLSTSSMSGMPNRSGRGRGLAVRSRHAGQLHPGHLCELLEGVEAETAAADHTDSDLAVVQVTLIDSPSGEELDLADVIGRR